MSRLRRALRVVDEWIDTVMAVGIIAAGVSLATVVIVDGGTIVEVGLVLILVAFVLFRWSRGSHAWQPLRRRGKPEGRRRP